MRRAEIVAAILMAVLSVYLMWKSAELPIGWIADEGPGGGAFPFWLAAIMLVCCLWTMVNWYRHLTPPSNSQNSFMDAYALRMFILIGGALTVMIRVTRSTVAQLRFVLAERVSESMSPYVNESSVGTES